MNTSKEVNDQSNQKDDEIEIFSNYFELLSSIDQRLKKEDPEYRKKYYPNKSAS